MLTSTQCEVVARISGGAFYCPRCPTPEASEPITRYELDTYLGERASQEFEIVSVDGPDGEPYHDRIRETGPAVIVFRDDGELFESYDTLTDAETDIYDLVHEYCDECGQELS